MDPPRGTAVTAEINVVVLGDSKVGKTSIISQFTRAAFADVYIATPGIDYDTTTTQVDGQLVTIHICDTSGVPNFLWLAKTAIQEADAFIFVYDITEKDSFISLEQWHQHANRFSKEAHLPKMLLGNKCDLRHQQVVGMATAREFGIPEGMLQLETSARLGRCTQVAFALLAAEVLWYRRLGTVRVLGMPCVLPEARGDQSSVATPHGAPGDTARYAHLFKVMLLGAPRVGKTALRLRFCRDYYVSEYMATRGMDYSTRSLVVDGERVEVQVWDVSGRAACDDTRRAYYKGASGFLVVYDCTDAESFSKAQLLLKQLALAGLDDAPKVLVGNKCDVTKTRTVQSAIAEDFANAWRVPVVETSAKYGTNIDTAYMKVVLALKRQVLPWKRVYDWS